MGDLALDTAIEGGSGRYRAPLGRASFCCHDLGMAAFDRVELTVVKLRARRTAEPLRVAVRQDDRATLDAVASTVGRVDGLARHQAPAPEVPGPEGLRSREEHRPGQPSVFPFWDDVECRPIGLLARWLPPALPAPIRRQWMRLRPHARFADAWLDAARAVTPTDVPSWPSAHRHHAWREPGGVAPSLDLHVAFHEPAPGGG